MAETTLTLSPCRLPKPLWKGGTKFGSCERENEVAKVGWGGGGDGGGEHTDKCEARIWLCCY